MIRSIWHTYEREAWPYADQNERKVTGREPNYQRVEMKREENAKKEKGEREKGKEIKEKNTKGTVEWWKREREGNTILFLLRWGMPPIRLCGCYARRLYPAFFL